MYRVGLVFVALLVVQRAAGLPGLPSWPSQIILPLVFIVAPPLMHHERRWPYSAVVMGLAWDLAMEQVIGPGGIAWSAASLALYATSTVMASRSPRAWLLLGALGTLLVTGFRWIALLPLVGARHVDLLSILHSVFLTGLWCGAVGGVLALDVPARWRAFRARRLH